nr:amidase [Actinomycetota bacterium]
QWLSPLHGIPLTVKDVLHVAGVPTRAGSAGFRVDPTVDAAAVERLRAAGGVFVAKVATHELALGVTTPQAAHPLDAARIPGGSSGGSAIAVATGMGFGSIGTDTRASIRVPAALCGVVGFKPTYGLVPTDGVVTLSWTMDHVGPLASTVADASAIADALIGAEAVSLTPPPTDPPIGARVGVSAAAMVGASAEVAQVAGTALKRLEGAGVDLVETDRPSCHDFEVAGAAGLVISRCEALAFHRSVETDLDQLWPETADQLRAAQSIEASEYVNALRIRAQFGRQMLRGLAESGVCALALPTTLVTAPRRSEAERYLTLLARNVIPWSLLGWPAVSVPCGSDSSGLPVGLQIVGPPFQDRLALQLALVAERCAGGVLKLQSDAPR